jgi:RNAse (barnase) inhibitor barstar
MATQQTVQTHLQNATAPWSSLLVTPPGTTVTSLVKPPTGYVVRIVQGKKCSTPTGIFEEFARALEFPNYFGHNWDALEECLADLGWLPAKGYVILITEAQSVIPGDDEEYETLLQILNDAGEAWSKGQTADERRAPFHVFFVVSEQGKSKRKHWRLEELPSIEPQTPRPKRGTRRSVKQTTRRRTS